MSGLKKKLALAVLGLCAGLSPEVMASPFTETPFITWFSAGNSDARWKRNAGFLIHFVVWRESNPRWTVSNISWVQYWAGDSGVILKDDGTPYAPGEYEEDYGTINRPPWEAKIPEPSSALLATAALGIMALRRRMK